MGTGAINARSHCMFGDHPGRISEQPLRVGLERSAVIVLGPGGEVIALTPEAALASSRRLIEASVTLGQHIAANSNIARGAFRRSQHPIHSAAQKIRLHWQWLCSGHPVPLRLLVTGLVLPAVAGVVISAALLVLATAVDPATGLTLLPWLLALSAVASLPLAYMIAPALMDRDELRPQVPTEFRLSVVPR